jgi:hypothetical protein
MAMMAGDRRGGGGGYSTYVTRVPYELSSFTKKVLDMLAKGTTGEKLSKLLSPSSDSDLLTFQKDITVLKDQDSVKSDSGTVETLNALFQMASTELESRQPGPRLFAQFAGLLAKGTTLTEIQTLLLGASTDALRELPKYLDRMMLGLRSNQPEQGEEMDGLVSVVKRVSQQILDHRSSPMISPEFIDFPMKSEDKPIERKANHRNSAAQFLSRLFHR